MKPFSKISFFWLIIIWSQHSTFRWSPWHNNNSNDPGEHLHSVFWLKTRLFSKNFYGNLYFLDPINATNQALLWAWCCCWNVYDARGKHWIENLQAQKLGLNLSYSRGAEYIVSSCNVICYMAQYSPTTASIKATCLNCWRGKRW